MGYLRLRAFSCQWETLLASLSMGDSPSFSFLVVWHLVAGWELLLAHVLSSVL